MADTTKAVGSRATASYGHGAASIRYGGSGEPLTVIVRPEDSGRGRSVAESRSCPIRRSSYLRCERRDQRKLPPRVASRMNRYRRRSPGRYTSRSVCRYHGPVGSKRRALQLSRRSIGCDHRRAHTAGNVGQPVALGPDRFRASRSNLHDRTHVAPLPAAFLDRTPSAHSGLPPRATSTEIVLMLRLLDRRSIVTLQLHFIKTARQQRDCNAMG